MMILPYRLSITFLKIPVLNWVIMALTAVAYLLQVTSTGGAEAFDQFVLRDWDLQGMVGSIFLHGGIVHLLGNMLFLWVFGNAICSTVGNLAYPFLYVLLGVCAAALHLTFSTAPAIGASGAINGIIGMSLILFPVSKLDCAYMLFLPFFGIVRGGKFTISCFWMIALWCLYDVFGIVVGTDGVAYWAHLGGFIAGMLVAFVIVLADWVNTFDPTIVDVLTGRADSATFDRDRKLEARLAPLGEPGTPGLVILEAREGALKKSTEDTHQLWTHVDDNLDARWAGAPGEPAPPSIPRGDPVLARVPVLPDDEMKPGGTSAAHPKFRILRILRSNDSITCYFVNDGDQVNDLHVTAGAGLRAEIHPSEILRKGDPGWVKVVSQGAIKRSDLVLSLTFGDGDGGKGNQHLLVRSADR